MGVTAIRHLSANDKISDSFQIGGSDFIWRVREGFLRTWLKLKNEWELLKQM